MADSIFTVTRSTDPRLVQPKQTFCAAMGASAISVVSLGASNQNTSNLTFTIVPPSTQVMIQKAPLLDVTLTFQCLFLQSDGTNAGLNSSVAMNPNFVPFAVEGRDWFVGAAFPLGQLVSAFNITMNNAAVQQQNVMTQDLAHVLEGPKGRAGHGTFTRTPLTASWDDSPNTLWGGSASGGDLLGEGDVGPGVFNLLYCDGQGKLLPNNSFLGYYDAGGAYVIGTAGMKNTSTCVLYGRPVTFPAGAGQLHSIYPQMRMIDPLMCSPFAFNYDRSWQETGLYGISSLTIQAQLATASSARILQGSTTAGCIFVTASDVSSLTALTRPALFAGTGGFVGNSGDLLPTGVNNPRIWMTYLSPSVQSTLPPRSISTLCNLQYFQQKTPSPVGGDRGPNGQLKSQTLTFSAVTFANVPDLIMISIRPDSSSMRTSEGNWCATFPDQAFSQFTFANQSGLFSGWTSAALTHMSRNNGSRASVPQYGGTDGSGLIQMGGASVVAGGSVLLIRPGVDFPLPTGVAVGSTGQVQLAFQLNFNAPAYRTYVCTVTAISSGFWVTDNGVSRQLLVGLDEQTVLNAPESTDRFVAQRLAGGGLHSHLGLAATHGRGFMDDILDRARKTAGSAAETGRTAVGKARQVWADSGYGGGVAGGQMHHARASLAERLAE